MANKFVSKLTGSNDSIKSERAIAANLGAENAQRKIINNLESELIELKGELARLNDIGPDSTFSLRPIDPDFDFNGWVTKIQNVKLRLLEKQVELQVANETYTEMFSEETAN